MLPTRSIIKPLRGPAITTPIRGHRKAPVAPITRCYSVSHVGCFESSRMQALKQAPSQRRTFSTTLRLLRHQQYRPQEESEKKVSFAQLIVFLSIYLVISDTYFWRNYIEYPWNKLIFGQQCAENLELSFIGEILGKSPVRVFKNTKGALFLIVDKDESPESMGDSNVFVVRPEEWLKHPEWRKRGDPYEKFWARGPWGVKLEHLVIEGKKFAKVVKAKEQDFIGDLRIEVPKDLEGGDWGSEKMTNFMQSLKVGDTIWIQGPFRKT